jgi:hypothetical protein
MKLYKHVVLCGTVLVLLRGGPALAVSPEPSAEVARAANIKMEQ